MKTKILGGRARFHRAFAQALGLCLSLDQSHANLVEKLPSTIRVHM